MFNISKCNEFMKMNFYPNIEESDDGSQIFGWKVKDIFKIAIERRYLFPHTDEDISIETYLKPSSLGIDVCYQIPDLPPTVINTDMIEGIRKFEVS